MVLNVSTCEWLISIGVIASYLYGLKSSNVPVIGTNFATVVGPVLLNLAFTQIVPSWVNIKSKSVNTQNTVWTTTIAGIVVY